MSSPWTVEFSKRSRKSIRKISPPFRDRIENTVLEIVRTPFIGKALEGQLKGLYSLRVWPYRIIHALHKEKRLIQIVDVGHRQGIYK